MCSGQESKNTVHISWPLWNVYSTEGAAVGKMMIESRVTGEQINGTGNSLWMFTEDH